MIETIIGSVVGALTVVIADKVHDYFWMRKCARTQKYELPSIDRDFREVAVCLLYLGYSVDEIRSMSVWQAKITGDVKL